MLKTRSVWSEIGPADGLRILVTRFRGRRMPTDRYDVWMASLGPSERLLRDFKEGKISWADFRAAYRREMLSDRAGESGNRTIRNNGQKFTLRLIERLARERDVTLLCQCAEDERHCHRHLLRDLVLASGRRAR